MNQLTLKTVKNVWTKSLSVLDNPYVNLTLVIVLILYASKMFKNINEVINGLYKYNFIKLLVLLIIAYVAPKDTNIAILLGIAYVMSLENMNMEKFVSKLISNIPSNTITETAKNTCESVKFLQKALSMYQTIYNGLTNITISMSNLNDDDLDKIIPSLTNLNSKLLNITNDLKYTINGQLNGIDCKITNTLDKKTNKYQVVKFISPSTTTKPITFCDIKNPTTSNDNILLSMALIADNIKSYNVGASKLLNLTTTCITLNNSITNIISNIQTSLIGTGNSIADKNAQKIITALEEANKEIVKNITYGDELANTYLSKNLPILCSIVNDNTYKNLISNLSDSCKKNVADQLFNLIKPDINKYAKYLTTPQKQTILQSINSNVMKNININNIIDPNAPWLKNCDKYSLSTNTASTLIKTIKSDTNTYYKGIVQVMNILINKPKQTYITTILNNQTKSNPLNDFGNGLLIAYNNLFYLETDNTSTKPYINNKTIDIDKSITDIKNTNLSELAKAYAIGILVGNYYFLNKNDINDITTMKGYIKKLNKINTLIKTVINKVLLSVENMSDDAQAEAIGIATGISTLGYFNLETIQYLNNKTNINTISQNAKKVTKTVLQNNKILDSVEAYVEGMIIAHVLINNYIENVDDTINSLTSLDKAKNYSCGLYDASGFNYDTFEGTSIWNNIFNSLMF